jgi:tetratricopeptide (TPR) repeat protein
LDDAVAQYEKVLEINPDYLNAHYNVGIALFQKGQLDEPIAVFQKAVKINPNSYIIRFNLGKANYIPFCFLRILAGILFLLDNRGTGLA